MEDGGRYQSYSSHYSFLIHLKGWQRKTMGNCNQRETQMYPPLHCSTVTILPDESVGSVGSPVPCYVNMLTLITIFTQFG